MSCVLYDKIVFGPIKSRRLGASLGINLLPEDKKVCSFDCVYCECGWTEIRHYDPHELYRRKSVIPVLEEKLKKLKADGVHIDSLTFAGNGEPTIHPEFPEIVADIVRLRDTYYPQSVISCLSNSTQLGRPEVRKALQMINNPILKLDAGNQSMYEAINRPIDTISQEEVVEHLMEFEGKLTVQSMFLHGEVKGVSVDNTGEKEVDSWLKDIARIKPEKLMLYSLDRDTPAKELLKASREEMEAIAEKVNNLNLNISTSIY